jgi:predicted Zn-dependent protease
MQPLNLLTVAREAGDETDLVQIVDDAKTFFPTEAWYEIRYLGELSLKHDLEIMDGGKACEAFLFKRLLQRFRKVKDSNGLAGLLLGITPKPVVDLYYSFDGGSLRKTVFFVRDYVSKKIGVVSLFKLAEESTSKVVAHGLGHNQGLRHHLEPTDLMHSELLRLAHLEVDGFCSACLQSLTRSASS